MQLNIQTVWLKYQDREERVGRCHNWRENGSETFIHADTKLIARNPENINKKL